MTDATAGVHRVVEAPPAWMTALEQRSFLELGAFMAASPLLRFAGRGDRHPVLVLPGFSAGDRSTVPLRWFLRGQGYWVHGWHLGRNMGPTQRIMTGIHERLSELHARHGRQVSLIGWSLGGVYARELARDSSEMVRQVITLGSPFRLIEGDHSAAEDLWRQRERYFADLTPFQVPEDEKTPLQVPATSIYSRGDGVVRWYACLESAGPLRENIEVHGSHSGLGFNPAALYAIADRLAQREGEWKPFRRPLGAGCLYPHPATWRSPARASA